MQQKKKNNKSFIKIFGNIIGYYRKKHKKSIYLISAESSIAKSCWRELELGLKEDVKLSTFCKIAEGLDIPPHMLLKELTDKLGESFSFSDLDN